MMLKQLLPDQYPTVLPLYTDQDFNLIIRSVIEGNTPAWVFADDPISPGLALIWDRQDAILVGGKPDGPAAAGLREILFDTILPDARSRHIPQFALFFTPGWEGILSSLLEPYSLQMAGRYSYRYQRQGFITPRLPEGFTRRRIDDSLLESQLVNLGQVRGWIDSFWASPQDFLHTGFGYCAIHGDTIASWCLTVFAAGSSRELGLATIPEYRELGLATLVGAACIEHALAHEITLHWHCWADNGPSARVAEKLGFQLAREYTVYRWNI